MLRQSVMQYDQWLPYYMVDPPTVKKAVGAKGNADKEEVKRQLLLIPEIVEKSLVDLSTLDEHSIDAIAVGYFLLNRYRSGQGMNPE